MSSGIEIVVDPNPRGGLFVWDKPVVGKKYVIGVDTAEGLSKGDFATAVCIDGETCDVVATWRERDDPNVWGTKVAHLGWYYNSALLAIETWPSAHGVTAHRQAVAEGYQNLYRRSKQDSLAKPMTEKLGWATDSTSKPQLINRILLMLTDAAREGTTPIRDESLLNELRDQHWDEKGEMVSAGHDDFVIALGIALMVRDQCWRRGELRHEAPKPSTEHERYWAAREARLASSTNNRRHRRLRVG